MGCCLLAAIVIGRWLAMWDRVRLHWRRARARLLHQPLPELPGQHTASAAKQPFRLGPKAKLFVAMEVAALAALTLHEFSGAHHAAGAHPDVGDRPESTAMRAAPVCRARPPNGFTSLQQSRLPHAAQ